MSAPEEAGQEAGDGSGELAEGREIVNAEPLGPDTDTGVPVRSSEEAEQSDSQGVYVPLSPGKPGQDDQSVGGGSRSSSSWPLLSGFSVGFVVTALIALAVLYGLGIVGWQKDGEPAELTKAPHRETSMMVAPLPARSGVGMEHRHVHGGLPQPLEGTGNATTITPKTSSTTPLPDLAADPDICNVEAPFPKLVADRAWILDPSWQRICAKRWFEDGTANIYPFDRNWCWVGYKTECHWDLKNHRSWHTVQNTAANNGGTVPRVHGPFSPLEDPEVCDYPEAGAPQNWTASDTEAARQWFNRTISVYVLSLESEQARWDAISKRLQDLQINATRVYGVDMREDGALDLAKQEGMVPSKYNFTRAQEISYSWKQQMGSILGTLGCASGHFKVQDTAFNEGSTLALVFEDDVYPEDDFVERLWGLVTQELPCDWEVTTLMSRCPYGKCVSQHLTRVQPDYNEPAWGCRHGVNWGMQGVLYRVSSIPRVQKMWKPVVYDENRPHCMDVDVALASISDRLGYYAVPSVQDPGFLQETDAESARWSINVAGSKITK